MEGSHFTGNPDARLLLERLRKLRTKLKRLLPAVNRSHTKKDLHDLRIILFRIHAAINLARSPGIRSQIRRLDRDIMRLYQALGPQRELDVMLRDAKDMKIKIPKLHALRRKARRKMQHALKSGRRDRLEKRFRKALDKIQQEPKLDLTPPLDTLRKNLTRLQRSPLPTRKQAHAWRVIMKKTRYSLEIIHPPPSPIIMLQAHLGRAHDLAVLRKLAGSRPELKNKEKQELGKALKFAKPAIKTALKQLATR